MATIKEIADNIGVNVATVSRILNKKTERYSADTIRKVHAESLRLNYIVDDMARAVKTGKSRTIGLVSNNVPRKLMQGFLAVAETEDYSMREFVVSMDHSIPIAQRIEALKNTIKKYRLAGVIFHYSSRNIDPLLDYLAEENIPCLITSAVEDKHDCAVHFFSDDVQGGALVAQYFLDCKYQNFICVYNNHSYTECIRAESFTRTVGEKGFSVKQQSLFADNDTKLPEYYMDLFSEDRSTPSAIFCATDNHALTVLTYALSLGLKVPQDVAVIGYGNSTLSRLTIPPLSTVEENFFGRGQEACSALIAMINGEAPAENKYFDVKLVVRESSER